MARGVWLFYPVAVAGGHQAQSAERTGFGNAVSSGHQAGKVERKAWHLPNRKYHLT